MTSLTRRSLNDVGTRAKVTLSTNLHELQVGYVPSLTVKLLPSVLRSFAKKAPAVRVVLHDMTTADMIPALQEERLAADAPVY